MAQNVDPLLLFTPLPSYNLELESRFPSINLSGTTKNSMYLIADINTK